LVKKELSPTHSSVPSSIMAASIGLLSLILAVYATISLWKKSIPAKSKPEPMELLTAYKSDQQ